jgi:hypothetical protein
MKRTLAVLVCLAASGPGSGCGDDGDDAPIDAAIDGPSIDAAIDATDGGGPLSPAECEALEAAWVTAVAKVSTRCDDRTECARVGGPHEETCDCTLMLRCETVAQSDAYLDSEAAVLEVEWRNRCQTNGSQICDCAPPEIECVDNECQVIEQSCFPTDAGS